MCNLLSINANARDLLTVLQQALENDPQWAAKIHDYKSSKEIVKKTSSGIKPTVSLNAQSSQDSYESDVFGEDDYNSTRFGATLVQPVLRLERWHTYRKGKAVDKQIDADYRFEEQEFYLRVTRVYLDVLRAEENLKFRLAEKSAIKRQLAQTEQRFKAGIIADTDVQEARAAFDISSVQYIIARQDQDLALENLNTLTWSYSSNVTPLKVEIPIVVPVPEKAEISNEEPAAEISEMPNENPEEIPESDYMQAWTDIALAKNFQIISTRFAKKAAQKEYKAKRAAHYPTLDFVGNYQDTDRFVQTGEGELQSSSISLKLDVPLYKGGEVGASRRQAQQLYLQSSKEYVFIKRETIQNTRNLYRVVETDVARVLAQKQSIRSAEAALTGTEAGYKAGTRTLVDVLLGQQALYGAKRDYANARFDYIFDLLLLKQIAGVLSKDDILEINNWLDSPTQVDKEESQEEDLEEI